MQQDAVKVGGGLVFWKPGKTNRDELERRLDAVSLKEFTPEPRSPYSALQGALQAVFKGKSPKKEDTGDGPQRGKHVLIRPLEQKEGLAIVREQRADGKIVPNSYDQELCALLPTETVPWVSLYGDYESDDERSVNDVYEELLPVLGSSAVSGCLDRILTKHLKAVNITAAVDSNEMGAGATGGARALYWVSQHRLDELQGIADAVEGACVEDRKDGRGKVTRVHVLEIVANERMIRAVGDGVTAEVSAEVVSMTADMQAGTLGCRAIETRRKRATQARERIRSYETAFGQYLEKLHQDLDKLDYQIDLASLLQSSAEVRELGVLQLVG